MISYLELLQMVKEGNAPELICLHLNYESVEYQVYYDGGEFNYYGICDDKYINGNFKYYLADTLLESQMIESNIEIVYQNDNKIEKLPYYSLTKIQKAKNKDEWREERISLLEKRVDDYHNKLNEIIDYINSKED